MPSRERAKGRKVSGGFALVPHAVLVSPAAATVGHAAFRVLVALADAYNGHNNGALGLTRAQARPYGITSNHTLAHGLAELEAHGLILRTFPGSRAPPRPALFAVTWKPVDETPHTKATRVASNAWRDFEASAEERK